MKRAPIRIARQRGVAIITALLLTTLAVTIVASLFWQQQVQVRSMENQRLHLQTRWVLRGGLDWLRLILNQDALSNRNVTAETGAWATPLAETRLDDYIERERTDNEKYDATLSGQATDAQARYNLANLASGGAVNLVQVQVFQSLLQNLRMDPQLAKAVAEQVRRGQKIAPASGSGEAMGGGTPASAPVGDGSEPLEVMRVEDLLAVTGFKQQDIEKLRDFVIVLPEATTINVNTASAELLTAIVENYSTSEATALIQFRRRSPFSSKGDFENALNGKKLKQGVTYDLKSNYFLVTSHVRLERAALDAQSLLKREKDGTTSLKWIREN
jgi:general secretion pathway protein K